MNWLQVCHTKTYKHWSTLFYFTLRSRKIIFLTWCTSITIDSLFYCLFSLFISKMLIFWHRKNFRSFLCSWHCLSFKMRCWLMVLKSKLTQWFYLANALLMLTRPIFAFLFLITYLMWRYIWHIDTSCIIDSTYK